MTRLGLISLVLLLTYLSACGSDLPVPVAEGTGIEATLERQWPSAGMPARQSTFSRNGELLATTDASGRVVIRRTNNWSSVGELNHPGGATAAAFSLDAARIYTAGYDGTVRLWDVADGRMLGSLKGAQGTVWSIDVSPDGRRLAAAGEDSIIRIWDLQERRATLALRGHERNVWEVRFSPDGRRLASGGFDNSLRLWNAATGTPLRKIAAHSEAIVGLAYSPDGRLIATGGDDSAIRIWRANDGALLRTIDTGNHTHKLAFSPDGRWLASAGRARSGSGMIWHQLTGGGGASPPVRLWRVADGALLQALSHPTDVTYVAFAPDGGSIVTAGEDGVTRLWGLRKSDA